MSYTFVAWERGAFQVKPKPNEWVRGSHGQVFTRYNRQPEWCKDRQIAFFDVVSYSKRVSRIQKNVIDAFTKILRDSITSVAGAFVDFLSKNGIQYTSDFIKIATGDGALIVIPLEGIPELALRLCEEIQEAVHKKNNASECAIFADKGWCNCHDNFHLRACVAEGKGIIYKDINDAFNVAGVAFNLAARILNYADKDQILLSATAYETLINLAARPNLAEEFVEYPNVPMKNMALASVYQYIRPNVAWLNREKPVGIKITDQMEMLADTPGFPKLSDYIQDDGEKMLEKMKTLKEYSDLMETLKKKMRGGE